MRTAHTLTTRGNRPDHDRSIAYSFGMLYAPAVRKLVDQAEPDQLRIPIRAEAAASELEAEGGPLASASDRPESK